ncbi:MAG: TMEM165/GDT1 family protein, partial [Limnochordia bacterium]
DKTQLAVFTLAARTGNPWSVFLGGGTAMVIVTLLGAYFGGYITRYVPERYVSLAAGLLFIAFGILFIYQGLRDCA